MSSRQRKTRMPHQVMGRICDGLDRVSIQIIRFAFQALGLFHFFKLLIS